ncbi:MAG: hypothetical protein IPK04_21735 [Bdellovibrionales bacterium]|nr:hypothetical protein [Bdellovibrionales bacterium]
MDLKTDFRGRLKIFILTPNQLSKACGGAFPHSIYEVHNRADKERHRDRLHEKLHKKRFDPLFAVNQRCAKLRSDIRRLTRRSWCTTKKPENLQGQLDLYIVNQFGPAFS